MEAYKDQQRDKLSLDMIRFGISISRIQKLINEAGSIRTLRSFWNRYLHYSLQINHAEILKEWREKQDIVALDQEEIEWTEENDSDPIILGHLNDLKTVSLKITNIALKEIKTFKYIKIIPQRNFKKEDAENERL